MGQKSKKRYTGKIDQITTADRLSYILLAFAVSIIPLIVFMKAIKLEGILKDAWTGEDSAVDFFSYWKAQLLILCLIGLLLYWIYRVFKHDYSNVQMIFVPLGIYALFVAISTIFAEYKIVAFNGFVDRQEGAYILFAYVTLLVTAATAVRTEKIAQPIITCLLISSVLIAILGLTQFYNVDFLQTVAGKKLILPKEYENIADSLKFSFSGQKIMYTTVYNPNYLGSYSALLLPVAIGLFFGWAEKRNWKVIIGALFTASAFILFLGGMSRAGILGGIFALFVFLILFRKRIIKLWAYSLVILVMFAGIYVTMDSTSGGSITKEVLNTLPSFVLNHKSPTDESGLNKGVEDSQNAEVKLPGTLVQHIEAKDNTLVFQTDKEQLNITNNNGNLSFTDKNGDNLTLLISGNTYTFEDPQYKLYEIVTAGSGFRIVWNQIVLPIINVDNNLYIQTKTGVAVNKYNKPETFGFKGSEMFASSRGYIWSRSIPMMKKTLILGHGPDTFAIYFPQEEIDAKINFLGNPGTVVDKPHNWYIQMGINTGVISLIAMLVFLAWYWIKGFFLWIKDVSGMEKAIGASILCGVTGYCIAAIFNDSVVSVAPVFWTLLGVGIAFVYKYAPSKKTETMPKMDKNKITAKSL